MLVSTTNQKRAATSSSLKIEEVEERYALPTNKIVINRNQARACDWQVRDLDDCAMVAV